MNDSYTNYYNNLGNIARIESNKDIYRYQYDLSNRLTDYRYNDKFKIKYHYDETSNVKDKYFNSLETSHYINYEYNKDNAVSKITFNNDHDIKAIPISLYSSGDVSYNTNYEDKLINTYDELGRLKEKSLNDNYKTNYHYITKGKRTSFILDKLEDNFNYFEYKYDELDNITDIYRNNNLVNHYEYDNSNQLIRDDDYERNMTTIYSYDNIGNILSKKEFVLNSKTLLNENTYLYTNTNWEDQLTKFNDEEITYDEIGNPLSIGNKVLNWTNGRQLESIVDENNTISYQYNKDGIRTKKLVNGEETRYLLENNNIIFEERDFGVIYYKRDESNHLIGFRYNDEDYYYVKNAQEDIISIMDSNYNVVANYKYDAYGKIISITDNKNKEITDLNHVAHINPFRYRSYYYDEEIKLYYLNSRYYNPEYGRFINADGSFDNSKTMGVNLYQYGYNNPVNTTDSNGNWPKWLKKAVKVIATVVVTAVVVVAVVKAAPVIAMAAMVTTASLGATGTTVAAVGTAAKVATTAVAVTTAVNGASKVGETITGTNVIRDKVMGGNDDLYNTFDTGLSVVNSTIIATGQFYSPPREKTTLSGRSLPRTGNPNSSLTMNKGGYNQMRFFDYQGNASLDIDFTNHPNLLTYHSNPHLHTWDNGIRSEKPFNIK